MAPANSSKLSHTTGAIDFVIQADGVSRVFETPSEQVFGVREVSLVVERGEFVCLMGPSGCGKSTLLALLAGLDTPSLGEVLFAGNKLSDASAEERAATRLRDIGMIFQDDHLIPEFTTLENVMFPLDLLGWTKADSLTAAMYALDQVGLSAMAERFPSELSGGQRQRVGIARAIAGPRQAIIADEATGSLDHSNSIAIFKLFRALAESGYAVIVATHDLAASQYAHRTLRMTDGSINSNSSESETLVTR